MLRTTRAVLAVSILLAGRAGAETITIGLGYLPNVQFTPFYVADRLGYFKAEGITVKFQHGYVSELMPLLLRGRLDFLVGDPEDAVFARNQGQAVKYVMAMYQKSPVTIFSLSPLSSALDLRGKTLGIPGPFGSSYHAVQALLDSVNLQGGRDVKFANVGFTQLDAVRAGRVNAAVGYVNNEVVQLRAAGQRVYTLDTSAAYPMVGVGLITRDQNLKSDLARRVVRASQRGLKFTISSPAQAFKVAQPVFGAGGGTLDILKASVPLMSGAFTQQRGLGASNPAAWEKAIAALVKQGQLKPGSAATSFYTNDLISRTLR